MKKIFTLILLGGALIYNAKAQTLLYSNDFEQGVNDAVIIGNGVIEDDSNPLLGKVFHNAAGGQAIRSNYLQLPATIFADLQTAATNAVSISFWVNKGTAVDYFWTPLFSAYGAAPVDGVNTWPMMILQSRGIVQVNHAGWCDFTDAQNVAGTNTVSTEWLDDNSWHFYTAVFTLGNVKVYIDGTVMNEWNLNGDEAGGSTSGLFTNGSALTYICLGGNQAWDWADPDPAYLFDKVRIHADALTKEQIDALIAADNAVIPKIAFETVRIAYNASNDLITVTGLTGSEKVELINVVGQKINVPNPSIIPTGNLSKGVYVLKVSKGSKFKTQKLAIN
ncbi:MAG: T9SS type A sorting domain-containing protein [Dysgonamonadaceae bacterium]|nr:T9SS type A sorting domain-containing protein [Dysgonamonadaceae bacterium]